MTAIRNFALAMGAMALGWLLWRVNAAIGDQALLLVFGIVIGLACMACVAIIGAAIWTATRQQPAQDAPQWHEAQPPVIIMLGDGTRTGGTSYQAPAGRFAAVVGEREEWVQP